MDTCVVRWLGPERELNRLPRKWDMVYDEAIGRDKKVTAHWQKHDNGDIFAKGVPIPMADKMVRSPMYAIVKGSEIKRVIKGKNGEADTEFKVFDDFDEKMLVKVNLVTVDEASLLREQNAKMRAEYEKMERENAQLRDLANKNVDKSTIPAEVQSERDVLTPKKKAAA